MLCLGYAWALLNCGELEACEPWLRDAERWINPTPGAAAQMIVVDDAEYHALPASIAAARAYRALALGDIPGTIVHARRALTLAAEDDVIRRTQATSLLGIAEYASGDLGAAERSLLAFQARMWQVGDVADALGITFILADIWLAQGHLRQAVSAYRQALQLAETGASALPIGTSDLHRGLSELLCEQGDLGSAARHLLTARALGEQAAADRLAASLVRCASAPAGSPGRSGPAPSPCSTKRSACTSGIPCPISPSALRRGCGSAQGRWPKPWRGPRAGPVP